MAKVPDLGHGGGALERLAARRDDPSKRWKFSRGDLEERKLWSAYMAAYQDMLSRTSTPWAPWWAR